MLDLVEGDLLWDRLQIFRSAAGGGKTSLLKLITPSVLLSLHANRLNEDLSDLYNRLESLQVIGEDGPRLLGVFLSCTKNYATLEDAEGESSRTERLLFALLNARIVLATLQAALQMRRLLYPQDLKRIQMPKGVQLPGLATTSDQLTGVALHDWATKLEDGVCEAFDSFDGWDPANIPGHDSLNSFSLLRPDVLMMDNTSIAERFVLLLDDVHLLTRRQRTAVLRTLTQTRSAVSVWIAERLEALSPDELLESGASLDRDYVVIDIEHFWRNRKRKFQSLALNAADRRARAASDVDIASFETSVSASIDSTEYQAKYKSILPEVQRRVTQAANGYDKFQEWLGHENLRSGTIRDQVENWRTLEILIHRERRKSQKSFDFTLSAEELEERSDSQLRTAAELFLAREFDLPYYFGPECLVALGSSNMEQLLWVAGEQFEEVVSAALLKRSGQLIPKRQDLLVRRTSDSLWRQISQRARGGESVSLFLEAVGTHCQEMTYLPNAPYDPGVTGIAISVEDRARLTDVKLLSQRREFAGLAEVIASAIANNLLEPIQDYKCKGATWMVLYLNRLLCPRYGLPLQYGGFKEKRIEELCEWLASGKPNRRVGGRLL